ncbi:hypothetical protein [Qipengyuania spongiae]|uniref:SPOR domain-containing protein n=1 Tax=Qipengyuania spongiae TaxID=2909673 RepID=A0ABY5T2E4_9SPHN|nr:hypothetical protein [Qipengyuania spongiae]UVI40595.1 hypothetical protein L1F33_06560 [Qipengyuania spongiae]
MKSDGDRVEMSEVEASGGSKEGVVRWVLIIGTLLAIVLLSVIWIAGAATQGDAEEEATVSGAMEAQTDGEGTDSILGTETADEFSEGTATDEGGAAGSVVEDAPQN